MSHRKISISCIFLKSPHQVWECFSTGAVGAQTRRSLGHYVLYWQIVRPLVILNPADFEAHSSLLPHIQIPNACLFWSGHEKCCQMLKRIFVVFLYFINILHMRYLWLRDVTMDWTIFWRNICFFMHLHFNKTFMKYHFHWQ